LTLIILKLKRINYNEYKFSFTFIISSFYRVLISRKHQIAELLLASAYFSLSTSNPAGIQISLFDWIQISNFKVDFGFLLDQLSILWLLFVTGIGSLIHMYSISYMHDDENMHKFAYLNLFILHDYSSYQVIY
jgi:NADH:ubiquinone oxidoreductase subunit 5 (subunit L)/multisubunit Na+/H+ antiporter MnhA subunit